METAQNDQSLSGQSPRARKRVHVKTWGCQMNVYDSARMIDVLAPLGFAPTDQVDDADLVILNTCHIREKATDKLYSELGRIHEQQRDLAARGERMMIAVAGCVAQAEGAEIQRRAPYVDMVFGPQTYHQLPEMIAQIARKSGHVLNTDFPVESKFDHLPQESLNEGPSAFLSVQEGCDKFCTFCVVPYTRGAEYSRPATAIIAEAGRMAARGVKEITLLGQNVNAYHGEGPDGASWTLAKLFTRIAEIPGIERLRYTTSHPLEMTDDLIAAHRDIPQLTPFLHLPVQSGSDNILKAMNRKHTRDDYRRIIDKLRAARPDIALSSDFIVGFPGESDQDFADTLQLVRETGFAAAYSFAYSMRPGTPAAAMPNQIARDIKEQRLHELQKLLWDQQADFNRRFIGKTISVLFDRKGRYEGQMIGRSPWMQSVHAELSTANYGKIMDVRINAIGQNSLAGTVSL